MKWLRIGSGFSVRLCLLALLLLVASAWAVAQDQPTSEQPSQSTTVLSPPTMLSWDDLDQASAALSQKASDLVPQVVDLNSQLGKLQSSLLDSTTLLAQSLAMRKQEALAAQAAVKTALNKSLWYQRTAFTVVGAFSGYLINKWPGSAIGAASGLAIDGGLELFRISF
jgi:16S rRNA G1207 methylase RsmC